MRRGIVLFVCAAAAAAASALVWHIETVDGAGDAGWNPSLRLDAADRPCISYGQGPFVGSSPVKYCRRNAGHWALETVDNGPLFAGCDTALAFDDQDHPAIAYNAYNFYEGHVKFAIKTGSQWESSFVATPSTFVLRLAVDMDAAGTPHVVYVETNSDELRYSYRDGGVWHTSVIYVSTLYDPIDPQIIVEDSGRRHVVFSTSIEDKIKYAVSDGGAWDIQTLPTTGDAFFTAFTLDAAGHPHICYCGNSADTSIRYVFWNGTAWVNEVVATCPEGQELTNPSLALDPTGRPWVSYGRSSDPPFATYDLYCAHRATGGGWTTELVQAEGDVGMLSSIGVAADGNPHIAYYENISISSGKLKYAYAGSDDPVKLAYFRASPAEGDMTLAWALAVADPTISGFNLYRRPAGADARWESLNHAPITGASPYRYCDRDLAPGRYEYRLEAVSHGATETMGNAFGVLGAAKPVTAFSCRPNPASSKAVVAFTLAGPEEVSLILYDVAGRKVKTLADGPMVPGNHEIAVTDLTPGLYLCRLTAGDYAATKRVVWINH